MPKSVILTFTDDEWKILEHDLLNPEQWLKDMAAGKVSNCLGRLSKSYLTTLKGKGVRNAPLDENDIAAVAFADPTYKNRKQREEEAQIEKLEGVK